jgi:hypothetical protein
MMRFTLASLLVSHLFLGNFVFAHDVYGTNDRGSPSHTKPMQTSSVQILQHTGTRYSSDGSGSSGSNIALQGASSTPGTVSSEQGFSAGNSTPFKDLAEQNAQLLALVEAQARMISVLQNKIEALEARQ